LAVLILAGFDWPMARQLFAWHAHRRRTPARNPATNEAPPGQAEVAPAVVSRTRHLLRSRRGRRHPCV